jgi:hypothetical protein
VSLYKAHVMKPVVGLQINRHSAKSLQGECYRKQNNTRRVLCTRNSTRIAQLALWLEHLTRHEGFVVNAVNSSMSARPLGRNFSLVYPRDIQKLHECIILSKFSVVTDILCRN